MLLCTLLLQYVSLLRATEIATDYHPGPKATRSSMVALRELQELDGMGQLLAQCEVRVRSDRLDFRKALIVPFHTAVRADYLQHQKEVDDLKRRLRSAEKNLHALMGVIKQVRRTCPCGRHTYRPRLDTEPAIVAVMPPTVDANSISDGRTHPFTNVQAYRPSSQASAASCSPATPVSRPLIYITDYFKKM